MDGSRSFVGMESKTHRRLSDRSEKSSRSWNVIEKTVFTENKGYWTDFTLARTNTFARNLQNQLCIRGWVVNHVDPLDLCQTHDLIANSFTKKFAKNCSATIHASSWVIPLLFLLTNWNNHAVSNKLVSSFRVSRFKSVVDYILPLDRETLKLKTNKVLCPNISLLATTFKSNKRTNITDILSSLSIDSRKLSWKTLKLVQCCHVRYCR